MSQKKNATTFLANLPVPKEDEPVSSFFDLWILILKKIDMNLFNKIERGDFLENCVEHGDRSHGLYMFDKNNAGEVIICNLETDWDDYGTVPRRFELITQFKNPNYWMEENGCVTATEILTFCSETYPQASFHNSCVYIPFSKLHDFVTLATQDDAEKYGIDILHTIKISYESDIYFVTDAFFYGFYYTRLTGTEYLPNEKEKISLENDDKSIDNYATYYVDNEYGLIKWIKGT
jgi:hypothetical protein